MDKKLLKLWSIFYINQPVYDVFNKFIDISNQLYVDKTITEKEKLVFSLRTEGKSFSEISKLYNEDVNKIRTMFNHVLREIKQCLVEREEAFKNSPVNPSILNEPLVSIFKYFNVSARLSGSIMRELAYTHKIHNPYLRDLEMLYSLKSNESYQIRGVGEISQKEWDILMETIIKLKTEKL